MDLSILYCKEEGKIGGEIILSGNVVNKLVKSCNQITFYENK